MKRYRNGTYGMVWTFDTGADLTGYTELALVFEKPDGTTVTKSSTDGPPSSIADSGTPSDGIIVFTVPSGLLNANGTWEVIAKVVKTGVLLKSSSSVHFEVVADFDPVAGS